MASNELNAYDVERAFSRIENELIDSMMRNLARHKKWETEEGFEWGMWQAEQLKTLEKWRKANKEKYSAEFKTVNQKIEQLLRQNYQDGQFAQEKEILESIQKGFPQVQATQTARNVTESLEGAFFQLNDRKLETLIKATTNDFEKAEVAVLRRVNDQYRKIIFDAQVYANTGAGTYEKAIDMATKDFLSRGIDCIQYTNGARHSISDYAEMAIRTASKRAYLQGEGVKRQEWGISTVIVHKRNGPCPKCLPFVGKVFIDDVWSGGSKDGKSPVTGVKYPLLSKAVAAGLYHPRCKDGHSTYYEGISEPPDNKYSKEELNRLAEEYKKEQKEQLAKRQQEKYGRLEKYSLDEENKKKYQVRANKWNKLIRKNNGLSAGEKNEAIEGYDPPKLLGTVDFSDKDMVLSILEFYEQQIVDDTVENAIVVTQTGEVWHCIGGLNGVQPDVDLGDKLIGACVTHNHPIGSDNEYSFSNADLQLFEKYHLESLRGIDEQFIYEITRKDIGVDNYATMQELIESYGDLARHQDVITYALQTGVGYRRYKR